MVFDSFIGKEATIKLLPLYRHEEHHRMIGGNKVSVISIAQDTRNPHFVDPKPSYIISLSNADLFVTWALT